MIEVELAGQIVAVPQARAYHVRQGGGPVIAFDSHLGKSWAAFDSPLPTGHILETTMPDESTVRMMIVAPANRHELIEALKVSPKKLILAKGYWYEVHAD